MSTRRVKINNGIQEIVQSTLSLTLMLLLAMLTSSCEIKTVDVPAADLGVKILVSDSDPEVDGKVLVVIQFFYEGKYVKLADNATVKCNDTELSYEKVGGLGYAERVPIKPEGSYYKFTHYRNNVLTDVRMVVPARPVITSPLENSSVRRSNDVTISYVAGNGRTVSGRAYGQKSGSGSVSLGAGEQPDNGTYSGLNVASGDLGMFNAGPGKLDISRELIDTHVGGDGFISVESEHNSGSIIRITWE